MDWTIKIRVKGLVGHILPSISLLLIWIEKFRSVDGEFTSGATKVTHPTPPLGSFGI
jgi:hypothetical protein